MQNEAPFKQLLDFEEDGQEQQEKESNVVDLKLVGGNSNPPDADWLKGLAVGTVFLARDKKNSSNYNLNLFRLMEKTEKSVVLKTPTVPNNLYIISSLFCRDFYLHEEICVLELEQEQASEEDAQQEQQEPSENEDECNRVQGELNPKA